ncbi:MAG: HAD family hydrolase [Streptosporangiaceae bacterium]
MQGPLRRLVLWDVDRTLIDVGGVGKETYLEAFEAVVGHPPARLAPRQGRTDPEIMAGTFALNDVIAADGQLRRAMRAVESGMAARVGAMRSHGRVLPGVREAIASLSRAPDVVQSVLTGNIKPNALLKLRTFDLDRDLDLDVGAYGSDDSARPALVEVARSRVADKHGTQFDSSSTWLIGDTPSDITAAREGGARVIAVATGLFDEEELRAEGADVVMPDLADTQALLRVILGDLTAA